VAFHSRVVQGDVRGVGGGIKHLAVRDVNGGGNTRITAGAVVNAAGLHAQAVAACLRTPEASIPPCFYAKGNYFSMAERPPFRHLIYPLPERGGLGIHLTLDLAGAARFGPDVEWLEKQPQPMQQGQGHHEVHYAEVDYAVDAARAAHFFPSIRQYWPGLRDGSLHPAYAGVRPKVDAASCCMQCNLVHSLPACLPACLPPTESFPFSPS
jgi:L-2-hydroxyglutarate oxidase LhgO